MKFYGCAIIWHEAIFSHAISNLLDVGSTKSRLSLFPVMLASHCDAFVKARLQGDSMVVRETWQAIWQGASMWFHLVGSTCWQRFLNMDRGMVDQEIPNRMWPTLSPKPIGPTVLEKCRKERPNHWSEGTQSLEKSQEETNVKEPLFVQMVDCFIEKALLCLISMSQSWF